MNSAPKNVDTGSETGQQDKTTNAEGRVVFSVTDVATDMSTISEINMKVSKVEMHSEASSWVTVSSTPKTYNLLSLNARSEFELLADVKAKAGTYNQVRLTVDSISVTTKGGATKTAKLPSGELKINTNLMVVADQTSSVSFDFLASKSLHMTGSGEYVFAPVVKTESRSNADVTVGTNSVVTIGGGKVDDENTSGMDIDGSVKINFEIKANQKLNIESTDKIKLEGLIY